MFYCPILEPQVVFTEDVYFVMEGDSVEVCVEVNPSLSCSGEVEMTLTFKTQDGSATGM